MTTEKKEKSPKQLAYEAQQADLALYEGRVQKMSHRQLLAELDRKSNIKYDGKGFSMHGNDFAELNCGRKKNNRAGVGNVEAVVARIILENTATAQVFEFDRKGNPVRWGRPDQKGFGTLSHYLR